jgi:hypothetical protein
MSDGLLRQSRLLLTRPELLPDFILVRGRRDGRSALEESALSETVRGLSQRQARDPQSQIDAQLTFDR